MAIAATDEAIRILIEERQRLDAAIRLLRGGSGTEVARPRRGRPPKVARQATKRRGRPPMTAAEKQAASERMKKYWADRKSRKVGKKKPARKAARKRSSS